MPTSDDLLVDECIAILAHKAIQDACSLRGVTVDALKAAIDDLDDDSFALLKDRVERGQTRLVLDHLFAGIDARRAS